MLLLYPTLRAGPPAPGHRWRGRNRRRRAVPWSRVNACSGGDIGSACRQGSGRSRFVFRTLGRLGQSLPGPFRAADSGAESRSSLRARDRGPQASVLSQEATAEFRPLKVSTNRRHKLSLPQFTAEAALYKSMSNFRSSGLMHQSSATGNGITLAGSCTCTDPGCTCTCPASPPPNHCSGCEKLSGCAQLKCLCSCEGGIPVYVDAPTRCGWVCT